MILYTFAITLLLHHLQKTIFFSKLYLTRLHSLVDNFLWKNLTKTLVNDKGCCCCCFSKSVSILKWKEGKDWSRLDAFTMISANPSVCSSSGLSRFLDLQKMDLGLTSTKNWFTQNLLVFWIQITHFIWGFVMCLGFCKIFRWFFVYMILIYWRWLSQLSNGNC